MRFRQDLWDKLKNEGYIINPPELDDENNVDDKRKLCERIH